METASNLNDTFENVIAYAMKYFDKNGERLRQDLAVAHSINAASEFLRRNEYTIHWCGPEDDEIGYETIYQYAAGEHFGKDKKYKEKVEFADSQAHIMKNGFNRIRERYLEQCGEILFMVPRYANRRGIQIITTNPLYVANESGQTVLDIFCDRETKMMSGQVKNFIQRSVALNGSDATKNALLDRFIKLIDSTPRYPTHPMQVAVPGPAAH